MPFLRKGRGYNKLGQLVESRRNARFFVFKKNFPIFAFVMKKILFILLVALCVSCTKTSDDVSPRLLGAFNYSESLKGIDGVVYKNTICKKGTGYLWAVEETPKGESRNWRIFEYKSINQIPLYI